MRIFCSRKIHIIFLESEKFASEAPTLEEWEEKPENGGSKSGLPKSKSQMDKQMILCLRAVHEGRTQEPSDMHPAFRTHQMVLQDSERDRQTEKLPGLKRRGTNCTMAVKNMWL